MNPSKGWVYLVLLLASWTPSTAGTAHAQAGGRVLPVEEMVRKSEVIGVATVQSALPRRDETTGAICTDYRLSFSEVWKGQANGAMILWKVGGQLGERATGIAGQDYTLRVGEEMVVFCHPSSAGNYVAIGLRQGLYRVGSAADRPLFRVSEFPEGPGRSSALTLQMLKDQVWRVLGRAVEARPAAPSVVPKPKTPEAIGAETPPQASPAPASGSLPAPTAPPQGSRLWAGAVVLLLLLTVATLFIIAARRASPGKT